MNKLLLLSILLFTLSCNSKSQLKKDLALLQSKEITFPIERMKHLVEGRDTVLRDFADVDLKLVVYTDSTGCSSCDISKMFLWNEIIENISKYNERLKLYFVFSPAIQDLRKVEIALMMNEFSYPLSLDTKGEFERLNPHLPKNPQLHSFLLDKENKVILVGNPLHNKQVEEMFYKMVEERLK